MYAGFTFSEDWPTDKAKIAIFKVGGKAYKIPIDESNECLVPWEALINSGTILISVSCGNRITATDAKVQILQSGYTDKEVATQDPTIDVYASLMDRMDEIDQNIVDAVNDALTEAHDSGYFQGEPGVGIKGVVLNNDYTLTIIFTDDSTYTTPRSIRGEQGYTPQKGVDYMTESDKAEFVDSAVELINNSGLYVCCGSVSTFEELPNDAKRGDAYNVINAYGDYAAGTNWVWNGEEWDALGGSIEIKTALDSDILEMLQRLGFDVNQYGIIGDAIVGTATVM